MIQNWKKGFIFFLSIVDWGEIFNGILLLLMGMVFAKYYGYRIVWGRYFDLCLWYLFIKLSSFCLRAILSGEVYASFEVSSHPGMNASDLRALVVKSFWILTILLIMMSFLPLIQLNDQQSFDSLALLIISLVYLNEFIFFLEPMQGILAGMAEFFYAISSAFLLPALCFSLSQNYLKSTLILVTFPLFLQLIAWKTSVHLEKEVEQKQLPACSLVGRLGSSNALYVISALLLLASLTPFLETNITGIWNKVILLPFGLAAAWLAYASIRVQIPNWNRAFALIRLLPALSILSIILATWMY